MTLSGFVTYTDVAETLPVDVREAIEIEAPCAGGFAHLWDWQWHDAAGWTLPEKECHWRCVHCGAVSHTDPRRR